MSALANQQMSADVSTRCQHQMSAQPTQKQTQTAVKKGDGWCIYSKVNNSSSVSKCRRGHASLPTALHSEHEWHAPTRFEVDLVKGFWDLLVSVEEVEPT